MIIQSFNIDRQNYNNNKMMHFPQSFAILSFLSFFVAATTTTTSEDKMNYLVELYKNSTIQGPLPKHNFRQEFCEQSSKILDFVELNAEPFFDPSSKVNNVFLNSIFQLPDGRLVQPRIPLDQLTSNLFLVKKVLLDNELYQLEDQVLGRNGEYTQELIDQHQLLLDFWNVPEEQFPILFTGAHSEDLLENMEEAIEAWLLLEGYLSNNDITGNEISQVANIARDAIETELGYNNSALSIDALFFPFYLNITNLDNKSIIIFADGMFDFVNYLGEIKVGKAVIHAHEFAHFLQFMIDLDNVNGDVDKYYEQQRANSNPFTTRRDELEADAMAAYALAHEKGRNFNVTKLVTTSEVIFHFGDCDTTNLGHHGSPKQRECAIRWGADKGLDMSGEPISPQQFRQKFNENLDGILSLDPSVCSLTEGGSGDEGETTFSTSNAGNSLTTLRGIVTLVTLLFYLLL